MNRKLMLQYLEKVSQMESQVYTLNRAYWDLHNQSERLGHPRSIRKPKEVKYGAWDYISLLFEGEMWLTMWAAFLITGCVSFFVVMIVEDKYPPSLVPTIIPPVVICLLILAGMIWSGIRYFRKSEEKYKKELKEYETAVADDALRIQQELEVKSVLCAQRDAVSSQYWAAKNALDALYNLDIIEREYRDFAAVTTFYSYFRKEYCTSLAGPNQAYDRYDHALEIGEIINKLDVIISKLDEIIRNQAYLAQLLSESNDILRRIEGGNKQMLDSMQRMEENTELTAYNTECVARSSEVTALLSVFNTLKPKDDE